MSLERRAVGEALNRLAFAAELLDDDTVDAKRCASLAWTIRSLEGELTLERIATLDGASLPVLAVVDDVAHGRAPPLLAALEAQVPRGLLEVRRLKGLGPKKIRALWQDLDVTSVGELEYACRENRLVDLKGFGKKTQDAVLEQIETLRAQAGLVRLDRADALAAALLSAIGAAGGAGEPPRHDAMVAGEVRRRCEVVSAVVVVTTAPVAVARAALASLTPAGAPGDVAGEAGAAVVAGDGGVVEGATGGVAVRIRAAVDPRHRGPVVAVETGSAAHVEALRERGRARGLVLEDIEAEDEEAVYDALGLAFVEPERREEGAVLVEKGRARPRLVRLEDLKGSLHNHTTASDGTASMAEMQQAAAGRGLAYLAVTDHSQSAVYARGLGASTLAAQREEARVLNAGSPACTLLCGVESDILKDGALDYPAAVLDKLDVVVASVHSRFGQKGPDLTARMTAAAQNPWSDIVGHPTGRLLLGRAPAEYDVSALLEVCAMTGAAVELNANPARLDLNERHLAEAKARGIPVSIAADAHATRELDYLAYGVSIARRAGLTAEDVLNTRPLEEVRAWLAARRARAAAPAGEAPGAETLAG